MDKNIHGKIRKVEVLGDRAKEKAKEKGLNGLVFVETEIREGKLPEYHLTNIEGSPTEFLKEKFLGEEIDEKEKSGDKEDLEKQLPIEVDLPLRWTLKWEFGLNDSVVRRVYREKGKLVDEDIISCFPISEAIPTKGEIELRKQMVIDEYNLEVREVNEDG